MEKQNLICKVPTLYTSIDFQLEHATAMISERRSFDNTFLLNGDSLTIAQVNAGGHEKCIDVSINDSCKSNILKNQSYLDDKIKSGLIVYGITTGFGASADARCSDTAKNQKTLVKMLNAGFGEVFSSAVTKSAMIIRANSLCRGMSGVRLEVLQLLCDMIKADIIPLVPKRGSISASGDLMPLSYIAAAMMGRPDCKVLHKGVLKMAPEALNDAGLTMVTFINKDALAVINAASLADALGCQVLYGANTAVVFTQVIVAMAVEALSGSLESFHPMIHECMPHPHQIEVAANIRGMLNGSKLAITELDMYREDNKQLKQDRYPLRTAAQWLAPAVDLIQKANGPAVINLNSINDNPMVDHKTDTILHGGNFQNTSMTVAMDGCRQGLQLCGKLLFAQMSEVINVTMNKGLPPNLSGCDYSCDFGFKGTDIAMASYMSELDLLTCPVTRHVLSAEMHNQSVNSLALLSARWTEKALTVLHLMLANIAVCLAQAIDLRWLKIEVEAELKTLCCDFGIDFSKINPRIWRWYDFVFDMKPTALKLANEYLPAVEHGSFAKSLDGRLTPIMALFKDDSHIDNVLNFLGEGTSIMYRFIRKTLGIRFYQGNFNLDEALQPMYVAIIEREIEVPLLEISKVLMGCTDVPPQEEAL